VISDFKYWEDQSDEYRDSEGTVLPLWKFSYERSKRMTVTALSWYVSFILRIPLSIVIANLLFLSIDSQNKG